MKGSRLKTPRAAGAANGERTSLKQLVNASCCEQDFLQVCLDALKRVGARITKPRLAVIECLKLAKAPLTPYEILSIITKKKEYGNVDKTSVYRILEALSELHLVHQVSPSGAFVACTHQQCAGDQHILTRCKKCGVTEEMQVPPAIVEPVAAYLKNSSGFILQEHFFQVDGKCSECG